MLEPAYGPSPFVLRRLRPESCARTDPPPPTGDSDPYTCPLKLSTIPYLGV